uniref:Uncharacterized protein n=1 Tax=Anguilla anguilla TaxID=7936 RepID=A0A0E9TR49_ANGAN
MLIMTKYNTDITNVFNVKIDKRVIFLHRNKATFSCSSSW